MSVVDSSSDAELSNEDWEPYREALLEKVRESPENYMCLREDIKEDPDICLATLLALEIKPSWSREDDTISQASEDNDKDDMVNLQYFFQTIFENMPDFQDHRPAFLRFVELGFVDYIMRYMLHFGTAVYQDRDFLTKVLQRDRHVHVYQRLPETLRSDSELVTIAANSVLETRVATLAYAVPSEALVGHKSILFRALDDRSFILDCITIPTPFWENRDFIMKWSAKNLRLPIESIPEKLSINDRELCLEVCRSQGRYVDFDGVVSWIPKPYLEDKSFVLECLCHDPAIFYLCYEGLQKDFKVLLRAAAGFLRGNRYHSFDLYSEFESFESFATFMKKMGKSRAVSFFNAVRLRIEAHAEFMTFLACLEKSRQHCVEPLSILDCDNETGRGLKTIIAKYLGFPNKKSLSTLNHIFRESVGLVLHEGATFSYLKPHIPNRALVQGILKSIEHGHYGFSLKEFPLELWSNRVFVQWAARQGMFHTAIPDEFAADADICLAYYRHSAITRENVFPWISKSLKSNPTFVRDCMKTDPLAMNQCTTNAIRYNFDVLLAAVHRAIGVDQLDNLMLVALSYGWSDSLVYFAKELRTKMEARYAFAAFWKEAKAHLFSRESRVKQLIGGFLGVAFPDHDNLEHIWGIPSIFCLAVGGNVEELCKTRKFRPKKQKVEDEDCRLCCRALARAYFDSDC